MAVKRLSKEAREFNIGIHTIVDYLHDQGIEIESNPNTKLDDNAYELLVNEFQSEKSAKEESESISKSRIDLLDDDPRDTRVEEEVLIKNVQGTADEILPEKEEKKEEEKEEPAPVEEKEDVKVVGKIDLDSMNLKTRPGKKAKEEKTEEVKEEAEPPKKEEEKKKKEVEKPVEEIKTKITNLEGFALIYNLKTLHASNF